MTGIVIKFIGSISMIIVEVTGNDYSDVMNDTTSYGCPDWKTWSSKETPMLKYLVLLNEPAWSDVLRSAYANMNTVLLDIRSHWL